MTGIFSPARLLFYLSLPGWPAIRRFPTRLLWRWRDSGWTPRMTVNIRFGATSIRKRYCIVFCAFQDLGRHAAANEFTDWHRLSGRAPAGYAPGAPWAAAPGCVDR